MTELRAVFLTFSARSVYAQTSKSCGGWALGRPETGTKRCEVPLQELQRGPMADGQRHSHRPQPRGLIQNVPPQTDGRRSSAWRTKTTVLAAREPGLRQCIRWLVGRCTRLVIVVYTTAGRLRRSTNGVTNCTRIRAMLLRTTYPYSQVLKTTAVPHN